MSVRTVSTSFTSSAAHSGVLASVDLNTTCPPGLVSEAFRMTSPLEKDFSGRSRYSGSPARNFHSNQSNVWGNSRSLNRPGNKRYPQSMSPLPSSSYNQPQNQFRRASFSGSSSKSMKYADNGLGATPLYQRTSRFDPFGDSNSNEPSPLSPSPVITSRPSSSEPTYTHFYYYDHVMNRPTLAYADDKSVNAANLTASTNILLDTLLNGRRAPSPPQPLAAPSPKQSPPPAENPARVQTRSPSPPSPRPRAAAISRPNPPSPPPASSGPTSTRASSTVILSSPPAPRPTVSKAQRDAIARVVANMLLTRADGPSRRGRRCISGTGYVKSGLSSVIFVE